MGAWLEKGCTCSGDSVTAGSRPGLGVLKWKGAHDLGWTGGGSSSVIPGVILCGTMSWSSRLV